MARRILFGVLVLALVMDGLVSTAWAGVGPPVPEMDPGSAAGAIALLSGAAFMLRDRFLRK